MSIQKRELNNRNLVEDKLPDRETEVVERRTINSKTFDLGNGKKRVIQKKEAIHFPGKKGWEDPDLMPIKKGDKYIIDKAMYNADILISRPKVKVTLPSKDTMEVELLEIGGKKFDAGEGKAERGIVYWEDININVSLENNIVSFNRIITDKDAPHSFLWKVTTVGTKTGSKLNALDDEGRKVDTEVIVEEHQEENKNIKIIKELIKSQVVEVVDKKTRVKKWSKNIKYPLLVTG